jgi:hypothetical protein
MANFGKRPINDAGQAQKTRTPVAMYHDGEQRFERRPYGKIERFVDPVGNVCIVQLSTPGDPKAVETAMRIRNEKHVDGWVEHAKCPMRHGVPSRTPAIEREFKKMPADLREPCGADPKVMSRKDGELYAEKSCPHVEWLIASRRKTEADANEKRNAARIREEKRLADAASLQAAQLEMVKEQLAERKAKKSKGNAE